MRAHLKHERVDLKREPKIPIVKESVVKSELLKYLKDHGILQFGDFILKSGLTSNYYINIKTAFGHPRAVELIVKAISLELDKHNLSLDITNVVGSGLGGHTFSSFILLSHKLFAGYDRGVAKKHGTGKVWEGKVPGPENNTLVLDDVYSNGTSMSETLLSLESQVGTSDMVKAIVVVVNRSDPKREFHTTSGGRQIPIISIFSSSDFI